MPRKTCSRPKFHAWLLDERSVPDKLSRRLRELVANGELDRALALLSETPAAELSAQAVHTVAARLFVSARYAECLDLCRDAANRWRDATAAFNAACASVKLDDIAGAFTWLERALELDANQAGAWLFDDPDVAVLRTDPRFAALLQRRGIVRPA